MIRASGKREKKGKNAGSGRSVEAGLLMMSCGIFASMVILRCLRRLYYQQVDVFPKICKMTRLKLTVHFQSRMPERNIDIDHVKQAIERPDEKKPDSQGIKVKKKVGEKTIVVVYSEEKFRDRHGQFLVITAYYI